MKEMCNSEGISDEKIQIYKVVDDETTPGGIVYDNIDEVVHHIQCWIENLGPGDECEFKVMVEEMRLSEFENLPEYE